MQNERQRRRVTRSAGLRAQAVAAISLAGHSRRMRAVPRSADLLRALATIDARQDPAGCRALVEWVGAEYARRRAGHLVGLVSRCRLGDSALHHPSVGHPYVDHYIDLTEGIIRHCLAEDQLPRGFTAARELAQAEHYLFVEIYRDGQVVPIRPDGTPNPLVLLTTEPCSEPKPRT